MLAFNEEERIGKTIARIPRKIPNIDQVEILVVNDGSTDNTFDLAFSNIFDHSINPT